MNLRDVAFVISAVIGLTAIMAAQRGIPDGNKASSKAHAKSVTITGCVAQGIDPDHYVLANAVRREQPPSSTAITGTSGRVRSDKEGASDRTGPYDLLGENSKLTLDTKSKSLGPAAAPARPRTRQRARVPRRENRYRGSTCSRSRCFQRPVRNTRLRSETCWMT
jgi:hypothetical protein